MDFEKLFGSKSSVQSLVRDIAFSPDGKFVAFLKGQSDSPNTYDLWLFCVESSEPSLLLSSDQLSSVNQDSSKEEKDRRERLRLFTDGILSYQWSHDSRLILIPILGRLFLLDVISKKLKCIKEKSTNIMDPKFSGVSSYVTYVEDQNVMAYELNTERIRQLTTDGGGPVKCGEAEFVVQEELSRFEGYWLSNNEKILAYEKYDESAVELVSRNEIYADSTQTIQQRYPFSGKPNVDYCICFLNLETGVEVRGDFDCDDTYLARGVWHQDNHMFYVQILNRAQNELKLLRIDATTGESNVVLMESQNPWVNINDDFMFSEGGDQFIWGSEREDKKQLYLYDLDGTFKKALTRGENPVHSVVGWANGFLTFLEYSNNALDLFCKQLDLETGKIRVLCQKKGMNYTHQSKCGKYLMTNHSSTHKPQEVWFRDIRSKQQTLISESDCLVDNVCLDELVKRPEFGLIRTTDGAVQLNYKLILPPNFDKKHKYAAIIHVYGGPHAQMVNHQWQGERYLFQQYLASKGFIVFSVDNRGSANRGMAFEAGIYKQLGELELRDQVAGALFLGQKGYVDKSRIGVFGWSYGGYMTLNCMMRRPDLFKVGVSGAPVTDWSLYDTCYTERYMSTPALNSEGYLKSSIFPYVEHLEGKLLVVHGMADDNVLFTHSTKLFSELQRAGRMFDIMIYPGEKHAVSGKVAKKHNYKTIASFFMDNL